MIAERRTMLPQLVLFRDSVIETPTMNRKNGKMRSVGVQPFHSA